MLQDFEIEQIIDELLTRFVECLLTPTRISISYAHPTMSSSKPLTSWKDNSLVVATGTAVATVVFCTLVGKEVILPTLTASLNNQLTDLQNTKIQKAQSDKEVGSLKIQLAESDRKLQVAQYAN
jgi:hypothetical protein